MLSRFDLIFVLLDRPDELMDQAMSEHIMALHSGKPVACAHYSMQEANWRARPPACHQ
jgi:DNA replicative helicase MCM subunit Mcm2 (Cdc46/Mcm family)